MKRYIGLIDGDVGGYGIVFPDLPGCVGMGATIEDAIANGTEALRSWLQAVEHAGDPAPEPSSLEMLRTDPDAASMWAEGAMIVGLPTRCVDENPAVVASPR